MKTTTLPTLALGDTVRVVARYLHSRGREGVVTMLPDEEYPVLGYNVDFGQGGDVAFERWELELVRKGSRPTTRSPNVKKTFYYLCDDELGSSDWPQRKRENRVIWWPEACATIEAETPEKAVEAIARKMRGRYGDGDEIDIYVSESPDVPGKRYIAAISIVTEVDVEQIDGKKAIRLPTPEEIAEEVA